MNISEVIKFCLIGSEWIDHRQYLLSNHRENYTSSSDAYLLSFKDLIQKYHQNVIKLHHVFQTKFNNNESLFPYINLIENSGGFGLNNNAFFPTIMMLGSPEQVQTWKNKILDLRIIGCYAQTELSHGSDVQNLQTIAEYDPEKKCFILNSNTIGAIKFWPGGLGINSSHSILHGKMIIKGKSYGIQTFIVPIRDVKTMKNLPGVEVGDIGPKLGFRGVDNGYLKLTNVHIPLDHLLMRYIKVLENGDVIKSSDKNAIKFGYGSMLNLRVQLTRVFLYEYLKSLIITYNQNPQKINENNSEKIIYLTRIGFAFTGVLTSKRLLKIYDKFQALIQENKQKEALSSLYELHYLSAGFKALFSWTLVKDSRSQLQNLSTGHLYLTGISGLYTECVPAVTYEGDNSVLFQLVAREILRIFNKIRKGKQEMGYAKFLNRFQKLIMDQGNLTSNSSDIPDSLKINKSNIQNLHDIHVIQNILEILTFSKLSESMLLLKKFIMDDGIPLKLAWNENLQQNFIEMSIMFIENLNITLAIEEFQAIKHDFKTESSQAFYLVLKLYSLDILKRYTNEAILKGLIDNSLNLIDLIHQTQIKLIQENDLIFKVIIDELGLISKELHEKSNYKEIEIKDHWINLQKELNNQAKKVNELIIAQSKL